MAGPLTISAMTSFTGSLAGTELIPIVSPGNSTASNANYKVTSSTFAALLLTSAGALFLNVEDQTLGGGANVTAKNLGTASTTVTVDCGARPLQYLVNNGAFTLQAPSNDGSCMVLMTNAASAGVVTFSGFSVGSSTGDSLTTTNGNSFTLSVWRINGISGYRIAAHQ